MLTFVQGIICVWLQEEILQTDHHGVEVKDRFPILAEDVQANIALQVHVWVIDLSGFIRSTR